MALAWTSPALAHGGGLDADGCHKDNIHGGYHCHPGTLKGKPFASKAQILDTLHGQPTKTPPAPTALPSAATVDCAKIKDPVAGLACYDKQHAPK
jgi:hypothetical protein